MEDVASMPLYAKVNLIKSFIKYRNSNQVEHAITKIILSSNQYLAIFLDIGIKDIFNTIEDEQTRKHFLNLLKTTKYYNKLSINDQITLLDQAIHNKILSGHEIAMDLLLEIPAPHARALITEIGKDMLARITSTDFNGGLVRLNYFLPEYKSIIKANFPSDEEK